LSANRTWKIWRWPIGIEVMSFVMVLIGPCWITTALLLARDLQTTVLWLVPTWTLLHLYYLVSSTASSSSNAFWKCSHPCLYTSNCPANLYYVQWAVASMNHCASTSCYHAEWFSNIYANNSISLFTVWDPDGQLDLKEMSIEIQTSFCG